MKVTKLKTKDIKAFRDKMLSSQNGKCLLCEKVIPEGKAVLDHSHSSKHIRGVLCNCCNRSESVIKTLKRYGMTDEVLPVFLSNLLAYCNKDCSEMPIHPKELTEDEKLLKSYKKLQKSSKMQKTKDKYQVMIEELKKKINNELRYWSE